MARFGRTFLPHRNTSGHVAELLLVARYPGAGVYPGANLYPGWGLGPSAGGGGGGSFTVGETAGATDSLTRSFTLSRSVSETAGATDTLTSGGLLLARSVSESAPAVDTFLASAVGRVVSETAGATDTVVGVLAMARDVSETAAGADTVVAVLVMARAVSETAAAVDSVLMGAVIRTRTVPETAGAVDTAAGVLAMARAVAETAAAVDAAAGVLAMARAVSETAGAVDSVLAGTVIRTRTASETAAAVDTVVGVLAMARSVSESAAAVDAVAWTYDRFATDSAPATDSVSVRTMRFTRAVSETAAAVDTVLRVEVVTRGVPETAAAVDTLTRGALLLHRSVSESASAVDAATRLMRFARSVAETAHAVDSNTVLVVGAGVPATLANPNWPLVGHDVDFQQAGPPGTPVHRLSINAPYRRLFVRQFSITRGRQYELDQAQAGTATLAIPDPLELLNPDNAGSPFNQSPNEVTPYRPYQAWAMWPNQPGSGNILNPAVHPSYDSSFETTTGLGGWVATSGVATAATSTDHAHSGTKSLKVTQTDASRPAIELAAMTAPGITYTFSAWVYPTGGCQVGAYLYDLEGNLAQSKYATAQNTWTRIFFSWTTVDVFEGIWITGAGVSTPVFYVDDVQLEFGSNLTDYQASGPTRFPLFTGYVERWPTTYDMAGVRAQRPLQAVDALAMLSRTAISQSYDTEVAADGPLLNYKLDNATPPTSGGDFGKGPNGYPVYVVPQGGSINWAADSHPDGTPAVVQACGNPGQQVPVKQQPDSTTELLVVGGTTSLNLTAGATTEVWIRWVSGFFQVANMMTMTVGVDAAGYQFARPIFGFWSSTFSGQIGILVGDGTGTASFWSAGASGAVYDDGQWHHMVWAVQNGAASFSIDGVNFTYSTVPMAQGSFGYNAIYTQANVQFGQPNAQVSWGRWAVYNGTLSTARRLIHYKRGTGYLGELSGARVTRLLSTYWGGAVRVAAGTVQLAADFGYNGRQMLDVITEIQETERGLTYAAADGTVVWEDRLTRYASQTSLATFGEDADSGELPYEDITFDYDPTYTFSQANLSRPGNNAFPPMVNATTQSKYGQRIVSQQAQVTTDFDLTQAGVFYLGRYDDPMTRVSKLTLHPSANPDLWPVVLGLEISQRVTVTRRTPAFTRSAEFIVEQINHSVDAEAGDWFVDLQLSPVFVESAWVLGDSTRGVLGSTTTPIY